MSRARTIFILLVAFAAAGCSPSVTPVITEARPRTLLASAVAIGGDRGTTLHTVELIGRNLLPEEGGAYNFDASGVKVEMKRESQGDWKKAQIFAWRPGQLTVQFGSNPWTASPGTLLFRVVHARLLVSHVYSNPITVPVTAGN